MRTQAHPESSRRPPSVFRAAIDRFVVTRFVVPCPAIPRRVILVILPLALLHLVLLDSLTAWAGQNSGGMLLLHANQNLTFSTDGNWAGWSELRDCKDAVTQVPGNGEGVIFFVIAAWPFGFPRMKAVSFGIKYSSQQVAPVTWGCCCNKDRYDVEYPDPSWPRSGSGNILVWYEPLTDSVNEVYWFASYAYNGNTFQLTPHPDHNVGGTFGDDAVPPELDDIESYGMLGFGKAGFNPCGGDEATGGCCKDDGQCYIRTRAGCEAMGVGATYLGDNTVCTPNPCTPGMGACCFGPQCRLVTWDNCLALQGDWQGSGVGCDPTPCNYSSYDTSWGSLKNVYRTP